MKQDDKFTVINIREYLKKNAEDEEQFGEDALRQLLSELLLRKQNCLAWL